jgi:ABC-2 type transport system permease protein
MSLSKTWSVIRKEVLHIVRDRRTLFLVTFTPAFLLVLLAYVFSFDVENFRVALFDQDQTPLSRRYVSFLTSDGMVDVVATVQSYREGEDLLLASRVYAVLVIPPGFERRLQRGEEARVELLLDGADPNSALQTLSQVQTRSGAFSQSLLVQARGGVAAVRLPRLEERTRIWYNPALRILHSMVPGLIAVVMAMPSLSISLAITREKEHGTLEALISTPLRKAELLVGKLLPYLVSGVVSLVLTAAVAIVWFRVPFRGNFGLFLLLGLDFLFGSLALSLFLSNFIGSQGAAMIANFLIFFIPSFFLTGLFDPIDTQKVGAVVRSYALPATHFVAISRALFLKGAGLADVAQAAAILLGMGAGCLTLAILSFRKQMG